MNHAPVVEIFALAATIAVSGLAVSVAAPLKSTPLKSTSRVAPNVRTSIDNRKPHIDMVFAIDCSGSMGDVIETAMKRFAVL